MKLLGIILVLFDMMIYQISRFRMPKINFSGFIDWAGQDDVKYTLSIILPMIYFLLMIFEVIGTLTGSGWEILVVPCLIQLVLYLVSHEKELPMHILLTLLSFLLTIVIVLIITLIDKDEVKKIGEIDLVPELLIEDGGTRYVITEIDGDEKKISVSDDCINAKVLHVYHVTESPNILPKLDSHKTMCEEVKPEPTKSEAIQKMRKVEK